MNKMRAVLREGEVFCHRCNGFIGRCTVCDGRGVLKRERFGVPNVLRQDVSANDAIAFVQRMPVDWSAKKVRQLHRTLNDEDATSFNGRISVFEATVSAPEQSSAALYAAEAMRSEAIEGALAIGLADGAPPDVMMVMPGGVHAITPFQNGKPVKAKVQVDRETAVALQGALEAHLALHGGGRRPWFNFDHNKQGPASAWPTKFEWRDEPQPGVYAHVEWSKAGADSVTGKMYRSFSPGFFVDSLKNDPAKIVGAPLDMGALVNEPAFGKISPLWCASSSDAPEGQEQKTDMNTAQQAASPSLGNQTGDNSGQAASHAGGAQNGANGALQAASAGGSVDVAELQRKLTAAEAALAAVNKLRADNAVKAAVARGAIAAKDEALQAHWREMIEGNPKNEVLLAAIAPNPALRVVTAADGGRGADAQALRGGSVMITREDSQVVLAAYAGARGEDVLYRTNAQGKPRSPEERSAMERGAIYAADIGPRIARGEEFPLILRDAALQAANSVGTLATGIVLQRTLELLVHNFPALSRFSTDFSGEGINPKYNQQINTRLVTIPTVTDYNTTTGYADSDATAIDVPVTINNHKAVQITFNEQDLASTARDLFGEQTKAMNYAIGEWFMGLIYSVITAANFPKTRTDTVPFPGTGASNETVSTLANFSRKSVMAVGRALSNRRVPDAMRFMLLSGDYYDKLGEDTVVVSAFNNPGAGDAIATGQLPDVHNFAVADAKILQTAENLVGFGSFPSALALAARVPSDYTSVFPGVTGGGTTSLVTESATGISLMLVRFIDHKLGQARQRAAFMAGAAKGDDRAGQRIVSAATP